MDTFIRIIGVMRDGCEDDTEPNTVESQFTARHQDAAGLYEAVDKAMTDIFNMNGMIVAKTPGKTVKKGDVNHLKFIPMHMLARIEFQTKTLSGETPGPQHLIDPSGRIPPATSGGYGPDTRIN